MANWHYSLPSQCLFGVLDDRICNAGRTRLDQTLRVARQRARVAVRRERAGSCLCSALLALLPCNERVGLCSRREAAHQ